MTGGFYSQLVDAFAGAAHIYSVIFQYTLVWAPFVTGYIFWRMWVSAVRRRWISEIEWTTLEIKLPKEIKKTPTAMEVVNHVFHQTSRGNWWDWYTKGRVRMWFSLELVSIEGSVHFFIRTPKQYKDLIEAQIYSQYPTIEIFEVQDYTKYVDYTGKDSKWDMFGMEFELTKPDAYPIKTYVDYHLDKEGIKPEEMTDPLTSVIEFLGSIGKGEQVWFQILIQPADTRFPIPGKWFGKREWTDAGADLIEDIVGAAKKRGSTPGKEGSVPIFTKVEENRILAIERSISKIGFDCGIRGIYVAQKEHFNGTRPDGIGGAFRQYSSLELNGFKPTRITKVNYPWQDYKKIRVTNKKKILFRAYKRRAYFYPPHRRKPFVLNTEELATIYHFPGGVAETPTFGRISAKKSEPPPFLPVK